MILRILLSGLLFRGVFGSHKVVMFKLRLALTAITLCALAVAGRAQQVGITVDTKPTSENIQQWLNSADPRMVAWGAYFASGNADAASVASMVRLVEAWTPPNDAQYADGRSRTDAMSEVLDALIQQKQPIPLAGVNAIASSFPRQAIVLASRLPLAETKAFLLTWYERRNSKDLAAFPRIAAMMLAKAPPPGFAASVLAESEEDLEVKVEGDWHMGLLGSGFAFTNTCGDRIGVPPPKGWPLFFDYEIEEITRLDHDPVIVEAGGDRITYHRVDLSRNSGSCSYLRPLNAATRHRLLAEMLGVTEKKMSWQVQERSTVFWKSQKQFISELKSLIASEEAKLCAMAKALYERGFLTKEESDSVRPKLSITVTDYRKPAGKPLPRLKSSDPCTTITFE